MSAPSPLPTPEAWVSCPRCHAQAPCYDPARSRYFGCLKCRSFFWANAQQTTRPPERLDGFKQPLVPGPSLALGAVAELGGYRCRLTGYQVRGEQQDRVAEWREYQLSPADYLPGDLPVDFPLQLAEYQGHWLLIRRAPYHPDVKGNQQFMNHRWTHEATNREFQLWHRYQPLIRDAQGEFDWNILEDEDLKIQEFIAPPYQLVSEKRKGGPITWYLAEYLPRSEVASAFGVSENDLPYKEGIGAAEPAPVPSWPQLRRLGLLAAALLVTLQLGLLMLHAPQSVLSQEFGISDVTSTGTSQVLASRSFTLTGPTALNISLQVPQLDNHWAEVTASLVNEQTGRGYEFTRSIEYYHGSEDGENWTEGGHQTSVVLHHVPSGRYHVNLYPTLDAGAGTGSLGLQVDANTPLWSNFWLALLALGAVPALLGWRHRSFERERWQNSNFTYHPSSD